MSPLTRRLLYPEPLFGGLPAVELTDDLTLVHSFGTAEPMAHRVPLMFENSAQVLVRVASAIGAENKWLRAGSLAQVLSLEPGDPKKEVNRLYLDEAFFTLDGAGNPYYLEFWPVRWLSDYYLEVWAQLAKNAVVVIRGGEAFSLSGEPFTIDGIAILI